MLLSELKTEQGLKLQGCGSLPQRRDPMSEELLPEILTTEIPPLPGGVAEATMVSFKDKELAFFKVNRNPRASKSKGLLHKSKNCLN